MDVPKDKPRTDPARDRMLFDDPRVVWEAGFWEQSEAERRQFFSTNDPETNHTRIERWRSLLKLERGSGSQRVEERFSLFDFLQAQDLDFLLMERKARLRTDSDDAKRLSWVLLEGGWRVGRALAKVSSDNWYFIQLSVMVYLHEFLIAPHLIDAYDGLLVVAGNTGTALERVQTQTLLNPRQSLVFRQLHTRTGIVLQQIGQIRSPGVAGLPSELVKPPGRFAVDTTVRSISLGVAIEIVLNAELVNAWGTGGIYALEMHAFLSRVVMGTRFDADKKRFRLRYAAMAKIEKYARVHAHWMKELEQQVRLKSRGMASIPGIYIRYVDGMPRNSYDDASMAERIAGQGPLLRAADLSEVLSTDFLGAVVSGTASTRHALTRISGRSVWVVPKKSPEHAYRVLTTNDKPVLLQINGKRLAKLGFYDTAAMEQHYELYHQKLLNRDEDKTFRTTWFASALMFWKVKQKLSDDRARERVSQLWQANKNDPLWMMMNFHELQFVFYDRVSFQDYKNTITRITYWDQQRVPRTFKFREAPLSMIDAELEKQLQERRAMERRARLEAYDADTDVEPDDDEDVFMKESDE
jgi:hypothetical protein